MIATYDRLREERRTADTNAENLSQEVLNSWHSCQSSHRFQAFKEKQLVIYQLDCGHPEVKDIYTCRDLTVNLDKGLMSFWESRETGRVLRVSDIPLEVAPSCFLWMLKYSSLEMSVHKGTKSLRFPLAYKTRLHPESRVDGVFYILERAIFNSSFTMKDGRIA